MAGNRSVYILTPQWPVTVQVDPLLTFYADVIIYINIRTFRFKDKNNYEYDFYDLI